MDPEYLDYINLVAKMREAQEEHRRTGLWTRLVLAQKLEEPVDEIIAFAMSDQQQLF